MRSRHDNGTSRTNMPAGANSDGALLERAVEGRFLVRYDRSRGKVGEGRGLRSLFKKLCDRGVSRLVSDPSVLMMQQEKAVACISCAHWSVFGPGVFVVTLAGITGSEGT